MAVGQGRRDKPQWPPAVFSAGRARLEVTPEAVCQDNRLPVDDGAVGDVDRQLAILWSPAANCPGSVCFDWSFLESVFFLGHDPALLNSYSVKVYSKSVKRQLTKLQGALNFG